MNNLGLVIPPNPKNFFFQAPQPTCIDIPSARVDINDTVANLKEVFPTFNIEADYLPANERWALAATSPDGSGGEEMFEILKKESGYAWVSLN